LSELREIVGQVPRAMEIEYFGFDLDGKLQTLYVFILSCLGVTTTAQIFTYAPMQAHIYGS
jgi:MHS family proline/betaine transporter-like MFS transporter